MRLSYWAGRNLICVGQALMQAVLLSGSLLTVELSLSAGQPALAKAQENLNSQAGLTKFEESVFGQDYPNMSFDERLGNLEKTVFGKVQTTDKNARIEALAKQLDLTAHNKLQPAIAPQLDTSETQKITKSPTHNYSDRHYSNNAHKKTVNQAYEPNDYDAWDEDSSRENFQTRKADDRTEMLLARATDLYSKGDTAAAASLFRQVVAIDPKNTDANYNLGAIAEGEGNYSKALNHYQIAQAANPKDQEIWQAVASMKSKLQEQKSREALAKQEQAKAQVAKKQQDNLKQLAAQAAEDFRQTNYDQAILKLNQVVAQAPNDPDVRYALAQAWRGKNSANPNQTNLEEARNQLKRAIALDPNNSSYRQALAELNQSASQSSRLANAPHTAPSRNSQPSGYSGYGRYGNPQYQDNSEQAGEIVPFSGGDLAAEPAGLERGWAYDSVPQSGLASYLPAAGLGLGALMLAPQFFRTSDQPLRSNRRVKRVITDGLAGATMGALMSRANGGSLKKGALFGGAVGLLFGGI